MSSNLEINCKIKWKYGIADFVDNKIIILKEPTDKSDVIEDSSVKNPINFDQIINDINKIYISYITISGIRRYSLIKENDINKASIKFLDKEKYMWNIFTIYKYHYIDHYVNPNPEQKTKKSLSTFIKTLETNVQPEPLKLCAQFVHWALNVAGFRFQGKYYAKLYHLEGLLKELGFHEIPQDSELKNGDIAVKADEKGLKNPNYYGHICIWNDNYWLCDDKSKDLNFKKNITFFYRYDSWEE